MARLKEQREHPATVLRRGVKGALDHVTKATEIDLAQVARLDRGRLAAVR